MIDNDKLVALMCAIFITACTHKLSDVVKTQKLISMMLYYVFRCLLKKVAPEISTDYSYS